jgi:hypothetical protein
MTGKGISPQGCPRAPPHLTKSNAARSACVFGQAMRAFCGGPLERRGGVARKLAPLKRASASGIMQCRHEALHGRFELLCVHRLPFRKGQFRKIKLDVIERQ